MNFKLNFNKDIDVYVIISETLEHLLMSDAETNQSIFVDRNQVWFDTIQKQDRQDIGLYQTILPPLWERIFRALVKSDSLQIPIYADEWFLERIGTISVDAFISGCVKCNEKNPILWERLLIGAGETRDYRHFLTYVIN